MITVDRVRYLLDYDAATGVFRWKNKGRHQGRGKVGSVAGTREGRGYWTICADGVRHKAHRVAWLWVYGEWPATEVDHIDGDRRNNAIANLRLATHVQNLGNSRRRSDNTSGFKGVIWHRAAGRWVARIRQKHLGMFDTPEEAHAAYCAAARDTYGDFARAA